MGERGSQVRRSLAWLLLGGAAGTLAAQAPEQGCVVNPDLGMRVGLIVTFRQRSGIQAYPDMEIVRNALRGAVADRLRDKGYDVAFADSSRLPQQADQIVRRNTDVVRAMTSQNVSSLVVVDYEFAEDRALGSGGSAKYQLERPVPTARWREWVLDGRGSIVCRAAFRGRASWTYPPFGQEVADSAFWFAQRLPQPPAAEVADSAEQFLLARLVARGAQVNVKRVDEWGRVLGADPALLREVPRVFADSSTPSFASLSVGLDHTCGLTKAGAAYCWGSNRFGQLGAASADKCAWDNLYFLTAYGVDCSTTPVRERRNLAFRSLTAGLEFTCSIASSREMYCWGRNDENQLGDGTSQSRSVPSRVAANAEFASIWVGDHHACGLTAAGTAHCWGADIWPAAPKLVAGGLSFAELNLRKDWQGCGVLSTGTVYCWEYRGAKAVPVDTAGPALHGLQVLPFFDAMCALGEGGIAYCWGDSGPYLGNDTTTFDRKRPIARAHQPLRPVVGGVSFTTLDAGRSYTCGLTAAGALYCWGSITVSFGDGSHASRFRFLPVPTLMDPRLQFTSLVAGPSHGCALTSAGAAHCFGENAAGLLGDGTTAAREGLVAVKTDVRFVSLALGYGHTCGLTQAGAAYCWGSNSRGQLGDGTKTNRAVPARVR